MIPGNPLRLAGRSTSTSWTAGLSSRGITTVLPSLAFCKSQSSRVFAY